MIQRASKESARVARNDRTNLCADLAVLSARKALVRVEELLLAIFVHRTLHDDRSAQERASLCDIVLLAVVAVHTDPIGMGEKVPGAETKEKAA